MRKVISAALVLMMIASVFSINIRAGKAEAQVNAQRAWESDTKTIGLEMTDAAEFSILGHWLSNAEGNFTKVTDWYEDKTPVYMQRIAPIDENGTMSVFNKGEMLVFNYDLYKAFNEEAKAFTALEEDVQVACYLFGAEKKDGETGEFKLLNEYRDYTSSISAKIEAPYDNFVAMLVFVIDNTQISEFGSFVTVAKAENDFAAATDKGEAKDGMMVDIAGEDLKEVVAPANSTYAIVNAAKYTVKVDKAATYTFKLSTNDITGFRAYFTDENMDVINQLAATGVEGEREAEMTSKAMVAGTYYLVVASNNTDNRGSVKVEIVSAETAAEPKTQDITEAAEDVVLENGDFEITGKNNNVTLYVGDAAHVILNNAEVGGIVLTNATSSAVIEGKGVSYVNAQEKAYGITNIEGATAGAYITGDVIKVSAVEKTVGAVLMHDAPLHVMSKLFIIKATEVEGYYPVGLWVIGKNLPKLTLAENEKINKQNVVSTMMYSESFAYGYTVATTENVFMGKDPKFATASTDFVIHTVLLGDANLDQTVDSQDATEILRYCAKIVEFTDEQMMISDVNYDLTVNTADAVELLKYVAEIIPGF